MEAKIWKLDTTHSNIGFSIKHMMFTNVKGSFEKYDGSLKMNESDFENAQIEFSAEIASISTNNTDRDAHLRSADFFDAEQFPTLKFKSTSIVKKGDHDYDLTGDLTIHGVTKPVLLKAEFSGLMKDPFGNTKIGLNINGKVNRKDWGLNWNAGLEAGGLLVSEDVKFDIETQLV
ncbi:YceI family protein [Myroides guanonis]|uniref:Polyisoprenoid-binding protein YceI n=1 Tax=Myroides guanonis TaxID=1150112 RepID=A0A1I3Q433_9FLAO|nr:YceI family protein [Myroides guanonis]SFJ28171.1 Polyisoprenoid-binding protein YceI [Myroides guanonis]